MITEDVRCRPEGFDALRMLQATRAKTQNKHFIISLEYQAVSTSHHARDVESADQNEPAEPNECKLFKTIP